MINSQIAVDFVKKCIMIKTVKTVFTVLNRQKTDKKYGLLTVRKKKPKMKPLKIRFFDGLKKKTDKKTVKKTVSVGFDGFVSRKNIL